MSKVLGVELRYFRNHERLSIDVIPDKPVAVIGPNGSGKTGVLEAISLLYPGRGIRSALIKDIGFLGRDCSASFKTVNAGCDEVNDYFLTIKNGKKILKLNDKVIGSHEKQVGKLNFAWLNPKLDILLSDNSSEMRRFFDRLIILNNPGHADNLLRYERIRKMRTKMLLENPDNNTLLDTLENMLSVEAVAVAKSRKVFVDKLNRELHECQNSLPTPTIGVEGWLESRVVNDDVLELFARELYRNRSVDGKLGKTSVGTHLSRFKIFFGKSDARLCSIGEQKMLLLSVIISCCRSESIILLDDINSHLDDSYQEIVADIISRLKAQTWLTDSGSHSYDPQKFNIICLCNKTP